MRDLVAIAVLAAMTALQPAKAHDIGVSQAELIEHEASRYSLRVQVAPSLAFLFGPPQLPTQCQPDDNPRGIQGIGWRSFNFQCNESLTANDELVLPWRRDGIMLTARWLAGYESRQLFSNKAGVITVALVQLKAGSGSGLNSARRYIALGIEHILLGIDHLLFVLALLIMVQGVWPLVKTITGFTVAHSITLGLATLGFVNVPSRPVEAAIALSIAFVCAEIIYAYRGKAGLTYRYPWLVAFAFGLLHGLGFAGALAKIGLPPSEVPIVLLFFNIGVEIGQLLFVAAVLTLIGLLNRLGVERWRPARIVTVYIIGVFATFWFVERTVAVFHSS